MAQNKEERKEGKEGGKKKYLSKLTNKILCSIPQVKEWGGEPAPAVSAVSLSVRQGVFLFHNHIKAEPMGREIQADNSRLRH